MLNLHLVRHAPTAPNTERRYPREDEDAPLTGEGRALAAGLRLPRGALAHTSPSRRALDTARLAGFEDPLLTPALAEARFGAMAGRTWAELEQVYGTTPRHWIEALAQPNIDFGPLGGETGRGFHARIQQWLEALPERGEVVAFTHAGPMHAALRLTVGLQAVTTPPGSVATLRRVSGQWWLTGLRAPDL
ncbi:histidine phosphatase family protein [Deinococcus navajonensis]|uniref:Histidine phosphatase family protein n=1 Tax=Deinococcus navajonensis TaxID=309884 RepID=A0ABV8XJP3_9DEIO